MNSYLSERCYLLLDGLDGRRDFAYGLARVSVLFLLAVMPYSHNAALKYFALFGMLTAAVWLTVQRRLNVDWRSPILLAIAGLLVVLSLTAAIGTDPPDSFNELRKHFLPGILLLLLIPQVFQGQKLIHLLLSIIALTFLLRAGLTLAELGLYLPDLNAGRDEGNFIKGFSLDAGFYIPALCALLLLGGRWRWLAPLGLMMVLLVMLLVQSRTPLFAAVAAVLVMISIRSQWRSLLIFGSVMVLVSAGVWLKIPQVAERFASTFDPQIFLKALDTKNYVSGDGFSGRTPIWLGVIEITAGREVFGYGFGWKKLGQIAVKNGFVARWEAKQNDAFAKDQALYFSQPPSKVNPHNLYLQIYFESGLIGLIAYGAMLLILFWQAVRLARQTDREPAILAALVLAYLVGHVILGLANGLWIGLGPSLALVALLETVRRSEKAV
ncbi:MAG: hypothetical protein CVU16_10515 [Betaproteobacteria bacterium HGW-Betaproteobacteria-10]|nr:MAG: hypothetical protein CVU16_10515 [Betaproteobacteria bacterium HGW-Betaproteobacteria-10]